MKTYIIIAFAALLVGVSSCKKQELPLPQEGKPAIWLEGNINGVPFKIEAGERTTFAHTIRHDIDSQLRQFIFRIEAPDQNKSFEISINNSNSWLSSPIGDLNNTIKIGDFDFVYSNAFPFVPYNTSEIIFLMQDHITGNKYYTIPFYQKVNAHFKIIGVQDKVYDGKKYKLAEINFSCRIKNPSNGAWYDLTDGHGFITFGEN